MDNQHLLYRGSNNNSILFSSCGLFVIAEEVGQLLFTTGLLHRSIIFIFPNYNYCLLSVIINRVLCNDMYFIYLFLSLTIIIVVYN